MTRHIALSPRLLALLLAGSTLPAAAQQTYNPSWYLLPSANTMVPDDEWQTDGARVGGGIRLGKPLSQHFETQFGVDYAWTAEGDRKYRQTIFGADILWMLSRKQWRPFLSVGAGGERDQVSGNITSHGETSPYVSGGAGLQAVFGERWFGQLDAKYVYGFLDKDKWDSRRDDSANWRFNLGIGYMFSVPPKPAPVAAQTAEPAPALAQPAPPPPPPAPTFEKVTLEAERLFDFNKATLGPDTPKLDAIAASLKAQADIPQIKVVGYTDRIGSDTYNRKLSQARADAVKARLVELGIPAEKIEAVGMGKANPVVPCDGIKKRAALIECLAPNRRVEVEPIMIERKVE